MANYHVGQRTDQFSPGKVFYDGGRVELGPFRWSLHTIRPLDPPNAPAKWVAWRISYYGQNWIFLDSLSLLCDGQVFKYSDSTPTRDVLSGGAVSEVVSFAVPVEVTQRCASSSSVTMRVEGETRDDIPLNEFGKWVLGEFLRQVGMPAPPRAVAQPS